MAYNVYYIDNDVYDSTNHALKVNIVAGSGGGGGGGLSVQDEAAWTAGTSNFTPSGGVYNDSAAALTSGQQGTERLTPNRATHTNLRNNSGTEIATASNPLRTDPTGTTTQPVSAASLPLPTGAALESGGHLANVDTSTSATSTVQGATSDAAVTSDTNGTISGKLRGLVKMVASVWDSVNGRLNVRATTDQTTHGTTDLVAADITKIAGVATASSTGLPVSQLASTPPSGTTMQNAATGTGVGSNTTVTGYPEAIINVTGTSTGLSITVQGSPDGGTTWASLNASTLGSSATPTSTITANGVYRVTTDGLTLLRTNVTAIASGNVTTVAYPSVQASVAQLQQVSLATLLAGEDITNNVMKVEQRFSYATISSATTTTIKSGAGFVHTISIVGGTLGAITVYDSTTGSGTTICPTFTPTATLPCPPIILDESFGTGLTIVTAAATIINVSYR